MGRADDQLSRRAMLVSGIAAGVSAAAPVGKPLIARARHVPD